MGYDLYQTWGTRMTFVIRFGRKPINLPGFSIFVDYLHDFVTINVASKWRNAFDKWKQQCHIWNELLCANCCLYGCFECYFSGEFTLYEETSGFYCTLWFWKLVSTENESRIRGSTELTTLPPWQPLNGPHGCLI